MARRPERRCPYLQFAHDLVSYRPPPHGVRPPSGVGSEPTIPLVSTPCGVDLSEVGIFVEFRWWAVADILASEEVFGPRDLGCLLADLLAHGVPASPLVI